jgi:hypothetical protein
MVPLDSENPGSLSALFESMRRRAVELVPEAVEGRSYAMPALL